MSDAEETVGDELGFDELLDRLRGVVQELEGGRLSLEDSLRIYEEGVGLARRGHSLLESAERRVELLVRASEEGFSVEPLPGAEDGE